jgi:hypothetical protein
MSEFARSGFGGTRPRPMTARARGTLEPEGSPNPRTITVPPIANLCRHLIAGLAATALLAAPATAGAATGCPDVPVSQPFAAWSDTADYFLAPGGDFEGDGWSLRGRAAIVDGNSPFHVGDPTDRRSLLLASGGAATSAPFCIGVEHRAMRFFARAAQTSSLNVDVLYTDARGRARSERIGELSGAGGWAATDVLAMRVNELAAQRDDAMTVQLRFQPRGAGTWAIDDVFIDPYRVR